MCVGVYEREGDNFNSASANALAHLFDMADQI